MPVTDLSPETADKIFSGWLEKFGTAFEKRDVGALTSFFDPNGYWKDILSFGWEHRVYDASRVREALSTTLHAFEPRNVRKAAGRSKPRLVKRSSRRVLEGFFDFDTNVGRGTAFVRLFFDPLDPTNPRIWLLLTTLQALHGFEDKVGPRRPTGEEYSMNTTPNNWQDDRTRQREFADRDPEVLIVGGGHAGLILAARLGQIGVDTLVVEKTPRIGDVWRQRYHSLTLHNESIANHMPYMPFPETWPTWLSKDRLAGWLESYAEAMELNVWTGTEARQATYDEKTKRWTLSLRSQDGTERTIRCKHLVVATGVSGSIPNVPDVPGLKDYQGEVKHSAQYTRGANYKGKNAIVVGTGNSAHDVAQDLYVNGAAKVWMYQRSPTCVVSLEPSASMVYKIYSEGMPVEDVDLLTAAIPYAVLEDTYKFMARKSGQLDQQLLESLNKAGFETYFGRDDTGFHMMYLRGEGGYYINVGCSNLIAEGKVGIIQARNVDRFVSNGLLMKDGTTVPLDLVVLSTGFRNMQEEVRRLVGDDIADRLGPVWGFDQDGQMRNMWRRTVQDGFWLMGGSLLDARLNSRFLAIEIKASLLGILPDRNALPLVERKAAAA